MGETKAHVGLYVDNTNGDFGIESKREEKEMG